METFDEWMERINQESLEEQYQKHLDGWKAFEALWNSEHQEDEDCD